MMKKITFRCRIITPLFMGGANQEAELRTQSFNGLFRYWFRLLGGSFEDEKRLFGWGGEGARRGIVQIFTEIKRGDKPLDRGSVGINYLAFSLLRTGRKYLQEDQDFNLTIRFHPTATDEDIKKFLCALWCAFYLGNFGSRSRRGFGSVMIENIEGYIPNSFDLGFFKPSSGICNWLKEQLEKIKNLNYWQGRKDIPWIFENMEIYKFDGTKQNFEDILNDLGKKYKDYRRTKPINDRIWFGLPIQKFIPQLGNKKLRRASPLIFKIISNGQNFEGFIIVFKPSDRHKFKFLPDGTRINLMGVNLREPSWDVIDKFIGYLQKNSILTKCYPFQEVENERVSHN